LEQIKRLRERRRQANLSLFVDSDGNPIDPDFAGENERTFSKTRLDLIEFDRQREDIQDSINQGVLTEAEGRRQLLAAEREYSAIRITTLKAEKDIAELDGDRVRVKQLEAEIKAVERLGQELTPAQALFKGLRSETELLSEKIESLGRNFRESFVDAFTELLVSGRNTFGNLFNVVKTAIARMSAELIASQLFRFFAQGQAATSPQSVGGGAQSSSNGTGGFINNILGSIFGGSRSGGGGGFGGGGFGGFGGFATPGINPNAFFSASTGPIGSLPGATIFNAGISQPGAASVQGAIGSVASGSSATRGFGFGALFGQFGGNLKNLFKGIGFGKAPGTAGGLAGALPLLGLTFGAGAGGSSILGQILGGAGGVLAGIGLTAAPAGLAASSPALAALFSNPITAIAGAGLLVGAIFLGRASQRRKDEEASGDFLQQAIDGIAQLREAVSTDQITGAQARAAFNSDILGTFRAQINTLKTKSVRESRLTNQVRDLQSLFESSVGPEITKQAERNRVGSRLTPEFAGGGMVGGIDRGFDSVNARLRPKEMVLTEAQQFSVAAMSGRGDIFQMARVPKAPSFAPSGAQVFANGGTAQDGGDIIINFENVTLNVTEGEAERISIAGLTSNTGRRIQIDNVKQAKRDGQLA
jgi:hypothetical protein